MKIKLSLFFLLCSCVSNAVQFSNNELKNIKIFSRTFFENLKNGTICIPPTIIRSDTITREKRDSNSTTTV